MPSASTSSSIDDSAPLAAIARAIARDAPSSPSSSSSSRDADDGVARAIAARLDATAESSQRKNAPTDASKPRPRPPKPDWGCARCGTRVNVVRWHSADAKWYYHHSRTRMCRRCEREREARERGRREAAATTTTTTRDDDRDGSDGFDDDDGTASDDDGTDDDGRGGRVARATRRRRCGQCGAETNVETFDAKTRRWTWTRPKTRMCEGCDEAYEDAARAYEAIFASETRARDGEPALAPAPPTFVYDVAD